MIISFTLVWICYSCCSLLISHGEVNGEVVNLRTVIDSDCELNILTAKDEKGLAVLRHTASHVLAQAVQTLFPDAKVAIGPSIDTGYYYDFDCPPFSRDDLDAIEKEMKKIIKKGAKIERFTKSREDAIAYFQEKNEPYKVELIEDLPEGSEISFYSQGDWTDLCAGPHLMSVKGVKAVTVNNCSQVYNFSVYFSCTGSTCKSLADVVSNVDSDFASAYSFFEP